MAALEMPPYAVGMRPVASPCATACLAGSGPAGAGGVMPGAGGIIGGNCRTGAPCIGPGGAGACGGF
jgi:hypothetical protein